MTRRLKCTQPPTTAQCQATAEDRQPTPGSLARQTPGVDRQIYRLASGHARVKIIASNRIHSKSGSTRRARVDRFKFNCITVSPRTTGRQVHLTTTVLTCNRLNLYRSRRGNGIHTTEDKNIGDSGILSNLSALTLCFLWLHYASLVFLLIDPALDPGVNSSSELLQSTKACAAWNLEL
ncbi:hypothetical protein RRG08_001083, partial [Elysia crispata]